MSRNETPVCLIEDDAALRTRLHELINSLDKFVCVGSFSSAEQALIALPTLQPSIILADINLPGMSGVECVPKITQILPKAEIIMLTVYDDTDLIFRSLAAGACGYLLKPVKRAQLFEALNDVLRGGAPMSSSIARSVVKAFHSQPTKLKSDSSDASIPQLSPKEQQILELLAQGLLLKEIADQFEISFATVQTHIGRIYKKLHVHSRAQAVAWLSQRGRN